MSFLRNASSSGVRPSGLARPSLRTGGVAPAAGAGDCARLERKGRFNMAANQMLQVFMRDKQARATYLFISSSDCAHKWANQVPNLGADARFRAGGVDDLHAERFGGGNCLVAARDAIEECSIRLLDAVA